MNRKKLYPWYFAAGAALVYFLLCFLPGILGIGYSFTDWNNFTNEVNFVGLDNYKQIFEGNSEYVKYIINTVVFTIVTTVAKTVVGLALALLLTQKFIKCKNFQRMIFKQFSEKYWFGWISKKLAYRFAIGVSYRYGSRYLERHGIHYGGCYSWVAFYIA